MIRTLLVFVCLSVLRTAAFSVSTSRVGSGVPCVSDASAACQQRRAVTPSASFSALRMAEGKDGDEPSTKGKISADGTFYDDEVDSAPVKQGISDSMKARLIREASSGLDSNKKQTNVLLYIIAGVAVLVILGGAGIFY